MARTNMNIPDDIDRDMRHEAVDLGLRYPGEFIQFLWKIYKEVNTMENTFARALGFADYSTLCEVSEIVHEEPGDITWFVTELPDGRWAAWDDAEISPHRVAYFDSRDEAVAFQKAGMEIAEASEQKKFILNLKDEGGIRTGYEQKLEGDTKEEVMQDYLHYLNHECNMIEDGELTEADVDCEEVDWE